jgi:2-polyprenyl-6-methoxyphenol hydroxylase-like FAD-dependent oxidoreductase
MKSIQTDVCIIGGGPAGLTLALELVKKNLRVIVVEQAKHYDRSFRGESLSPDSVYILDYLEILDKLEQKGFISTNNLEIVENEEKVLDINFHNFKYKYKYPIDLPQPVLLGALLEKAANYVEFQIFRGALCNDLITKEGKILGVHCQTEEGKLEIYANLVVGADGRFSRVRDLAKLPYQKIPLNRDVLWFRLPLPRQWKNSTCRVKIMRDRHALFLPTYPDTVRVGFNIPKGGLKAVKKQGIKYLHEMIGELEPDIAESTRENIKTWEDTSFLEIFTTIVSVWYRPGLVLIGDAAHTLSPILGQGVNHAIIDAITLAPIVEKCLKDNPNNIVGVESLQKFQKSREKDIETVRNIQLRQEKVFSFQSDLMTFLRRTIYRILNKNFWMQRIIWQKICYEQQVRKLVK